jgi:AAA domain-containing protein
VSGAEIHPGDTELPPLDAYADVKSERLNGHHHAEGEKADSPDVNIKLPSLSEMCATPAAPKVALISELLYPGAWLVVGRPKIGKSWLLLQVALAIAENGTFLGYPCQSEGADVLAIFGEDDDSRIQQRLAALGVARAPENCYVINQQSLFSLAKRFAAEEVTFAEFLESLLNQHPKVRLVIVDTETTARQVWAGERGQVGGPRVTETDYKQTRTFDELALRRQIVILLVNHASKRKGNDWTDPHELINRANTALAGASGSITLVDPPDADPFDTKAKGRVLAIRGRDLKEDLLLAVHQRDDMPYFLSDGPYSEVRQTQVEAEILLALEELMIGLPAGQYVSNDEIAGALSKNRGTVKRAVSRMVAAGRTSWKKSRVVVKRGHGGGIRLDPLSP